MALISVLASSRLKPMSPASGRSEPRPMIRARCVPDFVPASANSTDTSIRIRLSLRCLGGYLLRNRDRPHRFKRFHVGDCFNSGGALSQSHKSAEWRDHGDRGKKSQVIDRTLRTERDDTEFAIVDFDRKVPTPPTSKQSRPFHWGGPPMPIGQLSYACAPTYVPLPA